jgi:hypothetical protein
MDLSIKRVIFLILLAVMTVGCEKPVVEKPQNLIPRDRMVQIITDMHLAESVYQNRRYSSDQVIQFTEADFYYSVLHKYQVADSTFEKSVIYYSSFPTEFEKIYSRVLDNLNEMEQDLLQKQQQPVDIGTQ